MSLVRVHYIFSLGIYLWVYACITFLWVCTHTPVGTQSHAFTFVKSEVSVRCPQSLSSSLFWRQRLSLDLEPLDSAWLASESQGSFYFGHPRPEVVDTPAALRGHMNDSLPNLGPRSVKNFTDPALSPDALTTFTKYTSNCTHKRQTRRQHC